MFGWTGLIPSPCPSPPARGGRGRGPARLRREGEVGSSAVRAGGLDDFVDRVVPELQRRHLFRREYEGRTLRENLGLPRPANRFFEKQGF